MNMAIEKVYILIIIGLCFTTGGCASVETAGEPDYDIVIRKGRVIDGAGNPWVIADVAIKDGRFAAVGRIDGAGAREIDASGKYVTPGWIDAMDQSGGVLLKSGLAENKLRMGVTTAVGGEGGTPVPAEGVADYFETLEDNWLSINFATYYSATQARIEVIGDVARAPTGAELAEMIDNVDTAMRAGAIGVTTALIYPPATYQTTEELVALVGASAPYGGIYATHMRDEGADLLPAIEEAIEIGEKAGVKVEIFHLKAAYQPKWGTLMAEAGEAIETARARGVDVAANMYPYIAGGTGLEIALPPEVFENGAEAAYENLRDPAYRADLIRRVDAKEFGDWSSRNLVVSAGGWDGVVLANAFNPAYDQYRNRSFAYIASELDTHPLEVLIDIMLEALPNRAFAFYFLMSEDDVRMALRFPWVSIGSDAAAAAVAGETDGLGLPHPRAYGTFPRIISEYVRKNDVLTLEEAVRKMTSWPAFRLGFVDRGVIREGLWADIVVFDYEEIEDKATWEDGTAFPVGVEHVLVNGVPTIENGRHTGAAAGRVLRGAGARP